ncbi:hypothetical protein [Streptomyces sp. NPDC047079]|uniref:hypothetical protein n=1 Tax=Streptomyces sp. NPDC047079 TaxID=3154607 RepID=UPI0033EDD04E
MELRRLEVREAVVAEIRVSAGPLGCAVAGRDLAALPPGAVAESLAATAQEGDGDL